MRLICSVLAAGALAQTKLEDHRPPLFFREDWKETPAATPVTAEHLTNPKLQFALYGPGNDGIVVAGSGSPVAARATMSSRDTVRMR